ncbi:VWA domain-containing protein [Nocardioides panacis]|uniref:VWA domain-containing protein n=1 Tax=Nocardioides panacis TaxID=2849501 RepID=A0A975XYM4_9ACTN|nr:vWA domain-containing protein [Nocardioides panacis]QWZ06364.1 VWA domain-containing protein [Nocardioides panacis]
MTTDRGRGFRRPLLALAAWVVVGVTLSSSPALAAEGTIDHVETRGGKVQVLYSLPGSGDSAPDLGTVGLSLDDTPLVAKAELATGAAQAVRRTTVLAIDVSDSMKGAKFAAAKQAAQVFLDTAPSDLYVGIVTFAGGVTVAQEPTLDRSAATAVVDGLQLSYGTLLYPGIQKAVSLGGKAGSRSIIVLSDGRDTSDVALASVTAGIKKAGVKVDVVALAQSSSEEALLQPLSDAGEGSVISESNPAALGQVFAGEADLLAKQILITAPLPTDGTPEGTLAVSVVAGGETYTDEAFVTLPAPKTTVASPTDLHPADPGTTVSSTVMLAGLGALGLGALVLVLAVSGATTSRRESVESRIDVYTRTGSTRRIGNRPDAPRAGDLRAGRRHRVQGAEEQPWFRGQARRPAGRGGDVPQAGRVAAPARGRRLHGDGPDAGPDRREPGPQPGRADPRDPGAVGVPRLEALPAAQGVQRAARELPAADRRKPPGRPVAGPGPGHRGAGGHRAAVRRVPAGARRDTPGRADRGRPELHR